MSLFVEMAEGISSATTETVKSQLQQWISQQAIFIKALFADFCWES